MKPIKTSKFIIIMLLASFTFSSCSNDTKTDPNTVPETNNPVTNNPGEETENDNEQESGSVIFASGYIHDDGSGNNIAGYWKNSEWTPLSDGSYSIKAKAIALSDEDVFSVGDYTGDSNCQYGGYWKNNLYSTFDSIQDDSDVSIEKYGIYSNSILIDENNIFVTGQGYSSEDYLNPMTNQINTYYPLKGVLWDNDSAIILENSYASRLENVYAGSMKKQTFSVNDDSYSTLFIAGYCYEDDGSPRVCFWTRTPGSSLTVESPYVLEDDTLTTFYDSKGRDLDVVDTSSDYKMSFKVYVCGVDQKLGIYHAGYWVYDSSTWQSTWTPLYEDLNGSDALSILINDNIIYIGGYENNGSYDVAGYWKDGIWTALSDGTTDARVNSLFIEETTIYTGGYKTNSSGIKVAGYWKGSEWISLGDGITDSEILSVKVKK